MAIIRNITRKCTNRKKGSAHYGGFPCIVLRRSVEHEKNYIFLFVLCFIVLQVFTGYGKEEVLQPVEIFRRDSLYNGEFFYQNNQLYFLYEKEEGEKGKLLHDIKVTDDKILYLFTENYFSESNLVDESNKIASIECI